MTEEAARDHAVPLVESSQAKGVFMALFQKLYGLDEPVLPLGRILHWADVVRRLGMAESSLDRFVTRVFGGYFYNTTTPVPSIDEIQENLELGRAAGVHQFLVPTVRNSANADPLLDYGFHCMPWFIESVLELEDGVDADLTRRLGRHRARSIIRVGEKVEARYPARYYELDDIEAEPDILKTAATLHDCNVRKYGHAINFYSVPILKLLCASVLGEHVLICIRRDYYTGEAVQASISLIDRRRRQLYWLVQGIAREKVSLGYNLFIADAYQLFVFAERNGIDEINLSRGGEQQKLHLGANRFNVLNNWLINLSQEVTAQISTIAAKRRESLGLDGRADSMIGDYRLH